MNTAHTPGPWSVKHNRIHGGPNSGACQGIADMLGNCGVTATVNANARLIVAAPDLLDVAKLAEELLSRLPARINGFGTGYVREQLRHVIAQATAPV